MEIRIIIIILLICIFSWLIWFWYLSTQQVYGFTEGDISVLIVDLSNMKNTYQDDYMCENNVIL